MRAFCLACVLLVGCGEDLLPDGEVVLTTGQESQVWEAAPQPTQVTVDKLESGGSVRLLEAAAPVDRFSLGHGDAGKLSLSASDGSKTVLVRGQSIEVDPAGFAGSSLPLFISRTNSFARPPGGISSPQLDRPVAALVRKRFLVMAGGQTGDGVQTDVYDFGYWQSASPAQAYGCPSSPCRFRSFAVAGLFRGVGIGDDWAITIDFDTFASWPLPVPEGISSYAEVAGGESVEAEDGGVFIVGATRPGTASSAVLRVKPDGEISVVSLLTPRRGAAAVWVKGRGLVVAGGSDSGSGLELLPVDGSAFVPLPYPPDAVEGAALVALDDQSVVRLGGRDQANGLAQSARYALGCGTSCSPELGGVTTDLTRLSAFAVDAEQALLVGEDGAGETLAQLATFDSVTDVALREPRRGARAIRAPSGHIAVLGGALLSGAPATSLELFLP